MAPNLIDRRRSCDGKVRHRTEATAAQHVKRLRKEGKDVHSYTCIHCGWRHVGHRRWIDRVRDRMRMHAPMTFVYRWIDDQIDAAQTELERAQRKRWWRDRDKWAERIEILIELREAAKKADVDEDGVPRDAVAAEEEEGEA